MNALEDTSSSPSSENVEDLMSLFESNKPLQSTIIFDTDSDSTDSSKEFSLHKNKRRKYVKPYRSEAKIHSENIKKNLSSTTTKTFSNEKHKKVIEIALDQVENKLIEIKNKIKKIDNKSIKNVNDSDFTIQSTKRKRSHKLMKHKQINKFSTYKPTDEIDSRQEHNPEGISFDKNKIMQKQPELETIIKNSETKSSNINSDDEVTEVLFKVERIDEDNESYTNVNVKPQPTDSIDENSLLTTLNVLKTVTNDRNVCNHEKNYPNRSNYESCDKIDSKKENIDMKTKSPEKNTTKTEIKFTNINNPGNEICVKSEMICDGDRPHTNINFEAQPTKSTMSNDENVFRSATNVPRTVAYISTKTNAINDALTLSIDSGKNNSNKFECDQRVDELLRTSASHILMQNSATNKINETSNSINSSIYESTPNDTPCSDVSDNNKVENSIDPNNRSNPSTPLNVSKKGQLRNCLLKNIINVMYQLEKYKHSLEVMKREGLDPYLQKKAWERFQKYLASAIQTSSLQILKSEILLNKNNHVNYYTSLMNEARIVAGTCPELGNFDEALFYSVLNSFILATKKQMEIEHEKFMLNLSKMSYQNKEYVQITPERNNQKNIKNTVSTNHNSNKTKANTLETGNIQTSSYEVGTLQRQGPRQPLTTHEVLNTQNVVTTQTQSLLSSNPYQRSYDMPLTTQITTQRIPPRARASNIPFQPQSNKNLPQKPPPPYTANTNIPYYAPVDSTLPVSYTSTQADPRYQPLPVHTGLSSTNINNEFTQNNPNSYGPVDYYRNQRIETPIYPVQNPNQPLRQTYIMNQQQSAFTGQHDSTKTTMVGEPIRSSISRDSGFVSPSWTGSSDQTASPAYETAVSPENHGIPFTAHTMAHNADRTTNQALPVPCIVCQKPTTYKCRGCCAVYLCSDLCQAKVWGTHMYVCGNRVQ